MTRMNMRYTKRIVLTLVLIVSTTTLVPISVFAANPDNIIVLEPKNLNGQLIGKKLEYLIDDNKKVTINNIATPEMETLFKQSTGDSLNFGYIKKDVWVKFTVDNPSQVISNWYIEFNHPWMNTIDLYIPDGSGMYIHKKSDMYTKPEKREINHPNYFYSVSQKPGRATYYMRFFGTGECLIPLKIWSVKSLLDNISDTFVDYQGYRH